MAETTDIVLERLTRIERMLSDHTRKLDALVAGQAGHTGMFAHLQHEMRLVRGGLNDIGRDSVTPGEVESLHHDVNQMQTDTLNQKIKTSELDTQVTRLEGRIEEMNAN